MNRHIIALIYISCCMLCPSLAMDATARPEKNKREKQELTSLPEPDLLIQVAPSHQPLPAQDEVRPHRLNLHEPLFGIDVSHYQGRIDWPSVACDEKVSYTYVKATEGAGMLDDTYSYNVREARKAGIKVGCYHFFSPTASPDAQFENFSRNVNLNEHDLLPIIDVEIKGRGDVHSFCKRLKTFLTKVEKHYGIQPIIYTSSNFYNQYLAGKFINYKYMIARYHEERPVLQDDIQFVMWQFTANGTVSGIKGAVDRSCFMDDYCMSDILLPGR
ncbi:MAG: hypothetical protein NC388_03140 [Clostridium sp.]|nr:hypothetical protein [Clostridium sp.]